MFRGASSINLDAKGRLAIPAKYRERLLDLCSGQLVITVDFAEPCLLLFPLSAWEELEEKLNKLSNTNPTHRRLKRLLMGHASEVDMDGNGRILIPAVLREHAGLDKQIMLAGQGNTFQVWDEGRWNAQIQEDMAANNDASLDADELPDLSF